MTLKTTITAFAVLVSKPSEIYIDGKKVGSSNDISTPQEFNLTQYLTPGPHTVEIMIDNSSGVPEQIYASSHAYTEDTQTNWNGIIGEIFLSDESFSAPVVNDINPAFRNFAAADEAGMLDQAQAFHEASGKWAREARMSAFSTLFLIPRDMYRMRNGVSLPISRRDVSFLPVSSIT